LNYFLLLTVIWDNLLEFRIQMQKTLKCANQMPIPKNFSTFKSNCGKDFESAQTKCVTSVRGLVEKLNDLQVEIYCKPKIPQPKSCYFCLPKQEALLMQNPETKKISQVKR
jgi:hypothetical protein